jgi:hypothetical protein
MFLDFQADAGCAAAPPTAMLCTSSLIKVLYTVAIVLLVISKPAFGSTVNGAPNESTHSCSVPLNPFATAISYALRPALPVYPITP